MQQGEVKSVPLSNIFRFCTGYHVTSDGQVISTKLHDKHPDKYKPKVLKPYVNKDGYSVMVLALEGGGQWREYLHRLVNFAFNGESYSPDLQTDHIDNDKGNNHASNLRWITQPENVRKSNRRLFLLYLEDSEGNKNIIEIENLAEYARINNLNYSSLHALASGRLEAYKNFSRVPAEVADSFLSKMDLQNCKLSSTLH